MENASKALVMAGSVLLAIIIIATLLYAASTWNVLPHQEDENKEIRQLAEFNQQYESYNKLAIYGSDLISVLNKAINNNEKYDAIYTNNYRDTDSMYINIILKMNSDVEAIKKTSAYYISGELQGKEVEGYNSTSKLDEEPLFSKGNTYYLSNIGDKDRMIKLVNFMNDKIYRKRTFTNGWDEVGGTYYIYELTSMTASEFKAKAFKCTNIEYNSMTGRVCLMEFEERDLNADKQNYKDGMLND